MVLVSQKKIFKTGFLKNSSAAIKVIGIYFEKKGKSVPIVIGSQKEMWFEIIIKGVGISFIFSRPMILNEPKILVTKQVTSQTILSQIAWIINILRLCVLKLARSMILL